MRRATRVAAFGALVLALSCAPRAAAQGQDILGIYFDEDATTDQLVTTTSPQVFTGYLILRNAAVPTGVSGWECVVELQGDGVGMLFWELTAGYNFDEPPSFRVGIGVLNSLFWEPAIVLARGTFAAMDPESSARLFIHPHDPPSLEDPPGSGNYVMAPVYAAGHDEMDLHRLYWPRGSEAEPVAAVNPTGGPPYCAVTPMALDFGMLGVGGTRLMDFTVANAGGGVLEGEVAPLACDGFTVVAGEGSYSLGAGESRTVTVRFQPTIPEAYDCAMVACVPVYLHGEGFVPGVCMLEPPSLDFGEVNAGMPEVRAFTIRNAGATGLVVGEVTSPCPEFAVASGGEPFVLQPWQSREVWVRFTPPAAGPYACEIAIGGSCAAFPVQGVGREPVPICRTSAPYLDFGTVHVGGQASRQFVLWNANGGVLTGEVSLSSPHFSLTSGGGPFSLAHAESVRVQVLFEPTVPGQHEAQVTLGEAGCPPVELIGATPGCLVEPDTLDFGSIQPGQWSERNFTITNVGGGFLYGGVSENCAYYRITAGGLPFALPAGASRAVTVRYEPTTYGPHTCTIEISSPASCGGVACFGAAVTPPPVCVVTPTSLSFGQIPLGQGSTRTFSILNSGGGVLDGFVEESCEHYEITSGGGEYHLSAGQSRIVYVRFAPLVPGPLACQVQTGSACTPVSCSGTGWGPECDVWPASLDFGDVPVGVWSELSFSLINAGGGVLQGEVREECAGIDIVAGAGPYALARSERRVVTVRFTPPAPAPFACDVELGADCQPLPCGGAGVTPPPGCLVYPQSLAFGNVLVGMHRDLLFSILNAGPQTILGEVTESCGQYAIVTGGGAYELPPGSRRDVTVRFSPATAGPHTCEVMTGVECVAASCYGVGLDGPPPGQDVLGVYFDQAANASSFETSAPMQPVTAYLILTNPSQPYGVGGWECCVEMLGSYTAVSWTISGLCTNFLNAPCFAVGCFEPPPSSPAVVLGTVQFTQTSPTDPTLFYLHPTPIPSVPGAMVYVGGNDPTQLITMQWSSGAEGLPVAVVNGGGVIVEISALAPTAQCAGAGVALSWSCADLGVDGFHVYRRDGGVLNAVAVRLTALPVPPPSSPGGMVTYTDGAVGVAQGTTLRYSYSILRSGEEIARSPETTVVLGDGAPAVLVLREPYPNPFNPTVTIPFVLPRAERVQLEIFDVAGRRVRTLLDAELPAATHENTWDGKDSGGHSVPSGTYYCRLSAEGRRELRKLTLIR